MQGPEKMIAWVRSAFWEGRDFFQSNNTSPWTRITPLTISPSSPPRWIKFLSHKQPCLLSIFSYFNYLEKWGNISATRWAERHPRQKNYQPPEDQICIGNNTLDYIASPRCIIFIISITKWMLLGFSACSLLPFLLNPY